MKSLNKLSIIIPSYNDGNYVKKLTDQILRLETDLESKSYPLEIIVVESGTCSYFTNLSKKVRAFKAGKGRAKQMNFGASKAKGNLLLFLHADCQISKKALEQLNLLPIKYGGGFLRQEYIFTFVKERKQGEQYFKKHFGRILKPYLLWALSYNLLVRIMELRLFYRGYIQKIAYGDQGIFVRKNIFKELHGYKEMPLFEDAEFFKRLKNKTKIKLLSGKVYSYPRRHLEIGLFRYSKLCLQLTKKYKAKEDVTKIHMFFKKEYERYKERN